LENSGVRRLVLFGASDIAEIALLAIKETQIEVVAVVDDRGHNTSLFGMQIIDTSQVQELLFDRILITDEKDRDSVLEQLVSHGVPSDRIIFLA
jgi:hypothetical protein